MKECTLAGIQIDEGVYVAADVFSIHYDTHIWGDDADQFRPER
jgi:cytochrome P450